MNVAHLQQISNELRIAMRSVQEVSRLLDEGATIPFIARYRKEATGSLDEVAITAVRDRLTQLRELQKRREAILKSLQERELLTEELKASIESAETIATLEDLYLPYRPKRRTRAMMAREKGLEPLAEFLYKQQDKDFQQIAAASVNPEKGIHSVEEALEGARDIIAEWINENTIVRSRMRRLYEEHGIIRSHVHARKEEEGNKYKDYFQWEEPAVKAPSHRLLAMLRGENEGYLSVRISPPEEEAIQLLETIEIKGRGPGAEQVRLALMDSCKRLLGPSMETEIRSACKQRADGEAIRVFAENLRQLLLAPPLGAKNVLAIDPGLRTGCKVVCLDRHGKLLHNTTVFLLSDNEKKAAAETIRSLCDRFHTEAIAIGNGTGSRETESFVRNLNLPDKILIVVVNESGASVYSASEVARQEFPEHDVTVRGAVSIGRRLIDPLAELVKIDPKSIGVGQYQHDVDQSSLRSSLEDVVSSCVNGVGVEVNTASKELLTYVSGIGPQLASNIIQYRNENGSFQSRSELKKVPKLGPKAFEQSAGFLRIRDARNPLDSSAVHPESYAIVQAMAKDLSCSLKDLIRNEQALSQINLTRYVTDTAGLPTLQDILKELAKPGRDPREAFEAFQFAEGIQTIDDVKPGMKLPGIITNITAFGAFVDVGVHQDGLIHISQLADRFVKDPNEIVKVHQRVMVTVLEVDSKRKRISLSLKK